MTKQRKRRRNDIEVQLDLLNAVGSVLKKHSYSKLGINLVAEEAGIDKSVIYRKYGDFNNLLIAYIEKQDFWLNELKELGNIKIDDRRSFMKAILSNQFETIYKNEELQQFLVWELGDKEGFTEPIAIKREVLSRGINKQYENLLDKFGVGFKYISALIIAGIYYLILHKERSTFCESDITRKKERTEFIEALHWLVDLLFDKIDSVNQMEKTAKILHENGVDIEIIAKATQLSKDYLSTLLSKIS